MSTPSVPNCSKIIYLHDPIELANNLSELEVLPTHKKEISRSALKLSPADTIEKTLSHQSNAILSCLTSFLMTVNTSVSQLKVSSQRLSMDLRKQRKSLDALNENYSALSRFHLIKQLGNSKFSKKPPPEGMYS